MNCKIVKEQILNLDTIVLTNYYNKQQVDYLILQIQANPVDLVNYYNKQQIDYTYKLAQIQINPIDLTKYLLINDYDNQIKDYLLAKEYYTDRKRFITVDYYQSYVDQYYLAKFVDETTLLNPNYNIIVSQIQDLNDYMGSNYYNKQQVDQQIQNNKQILGLSNYYNKQQVDQQIQNNKQIVDLSNYYNKQQVDYQIQNNKTDLSNYYDNKTIDEMLTQYVPKPKRMNTQLGIYFWVSVAQIKDFIFQLDLYVGTHNYFNEDNIDIYFKDYVKQKDQKNYLLPNDLNRQLQNYALIADLQNYVLTNDLNRQLQNYVLTTDFNSQLQKYAQIVDLQKYVLTNDLTKQLQNYVLTSNLTTNLQTNYYTQQQVNALFNNFLRVDDYNFFKQDYVKKYDYNQFVKNCLVVTPNNPIQLSQNYSISCSQISDLYTNYYNQSQINDLMKQFSDYLLIKPSSQTQLNLNYQIATSQIINFYQILSNYVLQNDLLNSLGQYLLTLPTVVLPLNINYTINSTQIVDFNTQLQKYLLQQPTQKTQINTNQPILLSQVSDFDTQIKNYISSSGSSGNQDLSLYMLLKPPQTNPILLDPFYVVNEYNIKSNSIKNQHIQDYSLNSNKIMQNTITHQQLGQKCEQSYQLQDGCINYNNLGENIRNLFVTGDSLSKCDLINNTVGTYKYQTPFGFTNISYYYQNNVQQSTAITFVGPASSLMSTSGLVKDYINYYSPQDSCYQFSNNQMGYPQTGCYGLSYLSTFRGGTFIPGPMFDGFAYETKITIGRPTLIQLFQSNTSPGYSVSYITSKGKYIIPSDENIKDNIMIKTNYQDQLDKLLKLNIVTYSYGKKYDDLIKQKYQQLNDQNILQEDKDYILQQIDNIQQVSGIAKQGYTYQNLQECGFNCVLQDKQIMSDQYFDQKQYNKEKVKQNIQSQQTKSICETQMIPYVIMGIKALNEKIEQQSQRLDIIDQAMMKTHEIINEVSQQTDQEIQDVQQNSLLNSINSDSIEDIKNTINKLIYQFETSQKTVQKFQKQIVFLNSQIEQQQQIIDKQQQDIIYIKLKAKIV